MPQQGWKLSEARQWRFDATRAGRTQEHAQHRRQIVGRPLAGNVGLPGAHLAAQKDAQEQSIVVDPCARIRRTRAAEPNVLAGWQDEIEPARRPTRAQLCDGRHT